jgi:hypothetical protein
VIRSNPHHILHKSKATQYILGIVLGGLSLVAVLVDVSSLAFST